MIDPSWTVPGVAPGAVERPTGIAAHAGNVYVAGDRVHRFDTTGSVLGVWGKAKTICAKHSAAMNNTAIPYCGLVIEHHIWVYMAVCTYDYPSPYIDIGLDA